MFAKAKADCCFGNIEVMLVVAANDIAITTAIRTVSFFVQVLIGCYALQTGKKILITDKADLQLIT
jgi:hypothetical protein